MTSSGTICVPALEAHPPPELEGKYFHDRACNFVVLWFVYESDDGTGAPAASIASSQQKQKRA
eukprot:scaffold1873_cov78-Skeletonema_marinoi.AAC.1